MKKIFFFIVPIILLLCSCNEGANNKENEREVIQNKDTTKNIRALCDCNNANLEIPETIARGLIAKFKATYLQDAQDIATLPERVWIDACYIATMVSYIHSHSNPNSMIDGVRFYWGTNKNRNDKVQLFVTPTKNRKALWPNDIIQAGCSPQFPNYDNDFDEIVDPMLKRFNKIHRKDPLIGHIKRDNLSKGVWFSSCVLECISKTIQANPSYKLNGVFIYKGAYSTISGKVPGQIYPNQSTIVIVFSKLDEQGNTVEDFTIGEALFKNINKEWGEKEWRDALNHGELCPNKCD